jgi:hypothetical protein
MDTERDVTRLVQSWLRTDEHESADRVLDNVLALLDATPQRRSWWPARRIAPMNVFAKLAAAAAAVAVVALFAIIAIPHSSGGIGGSSAPPSLTPSPSISAPPGPSSSPVAAVFPPDGKLAIGSHSMTRGGVQLSIDVPTAEWHSEQGFFINKDIAVRPEWASFLFWDPSPLGVYADPCTHELGPSVGPSTADLAAAVSTKPGINLVGGPSDVMVGGRAAKYVVIKVPENAKCLAGDGGFYLWHADVNQGEVRYATALGVTLRVWIVDVDRTRLFIEAESFKEAGPNVGREIQKVVDSIQFE